MNTKNTMGLIALLAGVASNVTASNLSSFAAGDVLICFRNPGAGYDLVVDAGPVTTFTGYAANSRNTISAYSAAQLSDLNANYGAISWSAFTYLSDGTLYLTQANTNTPVYTQTAPLPQQSYGLQSSAAIRMGSIPTGALNFSGNPSAPYTDSTSSAIVEDDISAANPNYLTGVSYHDALFGGYGSATFNGNLTKTPEITTPSNFKNLGKNLRSDFYQVTPTSTAGQATMIGYFELNTNGTMSYVAYPIATPVIKKTTFVRTGNVNTFNYVTGLYGTYTLRGTNAAGLLAAPSTWPSLGTLSAGDLNIHVATDTTTVSNRFYIITAP